VAWLRRNFFGFWPPRVLRSAGVATSRFLAAALFYRAVWQPSTKTLPEGLQPNWGVQLQRKIWPISKSNSGWQPKKIHLQPKVRAAIRQKSQKVISGGSGPVLELLLFALLRFCCFLFACLFCLFCFVFAVSCLPVCFCRFCFVFCCSCFCLFFAGFASFLLFPVCLFVFAGFASFFSVWLFACSAVFVCFFFVFSFFFRFCYFRSARSPVHLGGGRLGRRVGRK